MRGKIFVRLWFIFSFIILILPVFLAARREVNSILDILKYEESIKYRDILIEKETDFLKFKENFSRVSGGVFGTFAFSYNNLTIPFYYKELNCEKDCFIGDTYGNCIFIKGKNDCFFENSNLNFNILKPGYEIISSCCGVKKKYVIEKIRNIADFNEEIYCKNNQRSLNILMDMPYGMDCRKILVKAKEVGLLEEDKPDFFSLILKNRYLIVVAILCFIFIFTLLVYIIRFFCSVLNARRLVVRKKYIKNGYNFSL